MPSPLGITVMLTGQPSASCGQHQAESQGAQAASEHWRPLLALGRPPYSSATDLRLREPRGRAYPEPGIRLETI